MRVNVKGISGSGKTTFGRALAGRLGVPYLELDAVHHIGPNWTEATPEELEASTREFIAGAPDGWVIDGNYESKLGDLVVDEADRIVWLDLPLRTSMRRLWRRTHGRLRNNVELWGGNRESWDAAFLGWNSLFVYAVRSWFRHRRELPRRFSGDPRLVRLRSPEEARRWLERQ
jgi:adenylate kinase family enzyme